MHPRRPTNPPSGMGFIEYAKDQPEFLTLPAFRDDRGHVYTEWVLSEGERRAIANGAPLTLDIWTDPTRPFPPLLLKIGNPEEDEADCG